MKRHTLPRCAADEGTALVIVLVFMVVVGLLLGAFLGKSETVTDSGIALRDRTQQQYALDAGAERALQLLRSDVADVATAGAASKCINAAGGVSDITAEAGGLDVNGHRIRYTCQTLAGSTVSSGGGAATNFAIVLTSTATDALTTKSGQATGQTSTCSNPAGSLKIGGSVYIRGNETDDGVTKRVIVCGGDIARYKGDPASSSFPECTSEQLTALTQLVRDPLYLKACTEQTVNEAVPLVTLPQAPGVDFASNIAPLNRPLYVDIPAGSDACRVFFPGLYKSPPALRTNSKDGNYFVSGLYYFEFSGNDVLSLGSNTTVTAGDPTKSPTGAAADVTASGSSSACNGVSDANALAALATAVPTLSLGSYYFSNGGAEWVFGKRARLDVQGSLTLNTAPVAANTAFISVVGVRSPADPGQDSSATDAARGYTVWSSPSNPIIRNQSASSAVVINGKVVAPSAPVEIFASNPTDGVVRGGLIAKSLDLGASVQGGGLAISAPAFTTNPAPPPFRTVRVVSKEPSSPGIQQVVEATISNYSPYTVTVLSWRTA